MSWVERFPQWALHLPGVRAALKDHVPLELDGLDWEIYNENCGAEVVNGIVEVHADLRDLHHELHAAAVPCRYCEPLGLEYGDNGSRQRIIIDVDPFMGRKAIFGQPESVILDNAMARLEANDPVGALNYMKAEREVLHGKALPEEEVEARRTGVAGRVRALASLIVSSGFSAQAASDLMQACPAGHFESGLSSEERMRLLAATLASNDVARAAWLGEAGFAPTGAEVTRLLQDPTSPFEANNASAYWVSRIARDAVEAAVGVACDRTAP